MLDVRLALRMFRTAPVVTVVAVLSLALGIGANSAIFSIADSLLLRRLPVDRPDRLVLLVSGPFGSATPVWGNLVWEQIRDRVTTCFRPHLPFRPEQTGSTSPPAVRPT